MFRSRLSAVPVPRAIRPAPFTLLFSLALLLLALSASSATTQYNEPIWGAEEVVDSGAIDITSSAGPGIMHTVDWPPWSSRDEWHVVYAKAGDIYHVVRTSAGWQAPEALTADEAISEDPKFAFIRDRMVVIWEDDRRGHPEIWAREWNGTAWSTEVGLADDEIPSQEAVITGQYYDGYAVWQEGVDGSTRIVGRPYSSSGWGAVQTISTGTAPAIEPSITSFEAEIRYFVAWADARNGDPEIYFRRRGSSSWQGEVRLTDMAGACRRPSVWSERCCGDVMSSETIIAFENDATGVAEVWAGFANPGWQWVSGMISADDGRASEQPQVHGFWMLITEGMGGAMPRYPVTWTDQGEPGGKANLLGISEGGSPLSWVDTLTTTGIGTSGVAALWGMPRATLATVWLEEREGATTLIAKLGTARGCNGIHFVSPPVILLSPDGTRGNPFLCTSECVTGSPLSGVDMYLTFDAVIDPLLTWDASQAHPQTQTARSDEDGEASLIVRGGGCSTTGLVSLRVSGVQIRNWTGAKSPDVNGDCKVRIDDLVYVQARVGTSDFCADLDGSGSVTTDDVAIVQEAIGSECSQLSAVDEPAGPEVIESAGAPGLRITPNPTTGKVEIRIEGIDADATGAAGGSDEAATTRVRIFDAAGRLVREIEDGARVSGASAATGARVIVWDGRDAGGRTVPPGLYYVRSGQGSGVGRAVVVVR